MFSCLAVMRSEKVIMALDFDEKSFDWNQLFRTKLQTFLNSQPFLTTNWNINRSCFRQTLRSNAFQRNRVGLSRSRSSISVWFLCSSQTQKANVRRVCDCRPSQMTTSLHCRDTNVHIDTVVCTPIIDSFPSFACLYVMQIVFVSIPVGNQLFSLLETVSPASRRDSEQETITFSYQSNSFWFCFIILLNYLVAKNMKRWAILKFCKSL